MQPNFLSNETRARRYRRKRVSDLPAPSSVVCLADDGLRSCSYGATAGDSRTSVLLVDPLRLAGADSARQAIIETNHGEIPIMQGTHKALDVQCHVSFVDPCGWSLPVLLVLLAG